MSQEEILLTSKDPDGFGGELKWVNPRTNRQHSLRVVMNFHWLFADNKTGMKKWNATIDGQPAGEYDGPLNEVFEELKKKV